MSAVTSWAVLWLATPSLQCVSQPVWMNKQKKKKKKKKGRRKKERRKKQERKKKERKVKDGRQKRKRERERERENTMANTDGKVERIN